MINMMNPSQKNNLIDVACGTGDLGKLFLDNTNINLSYAYQAELGIGQLGIGLSFGMYQSGLDGTQLKPNETGDNTIPDSEVTGSALDLGAGIYFNTQDVYFGLSSLHLTEPLIDVSDGSIKQLKQH